MCAKLVNAPCHLMHDAAALTSNLAAAPFSVLVAPSIAYKLAMTVSPDSGIRRAETRDREGQESNATERDWRWPGRQSLHTMHRDTRLLQRKIQDRFLLYSTGVPIGVPMGIPCG